MKGISGGQKRRVSVGIELVKEPRVLFLDEPTSGLDSEIAAALMHMLVKLARRGRTVVLTIHQPNSLISGMFDDFMLLSGGNVVYGGPWSAAVEFFSAAGHPCPPYTNPTDHFLSVLKDPEVCDALVARHAVASGGPLAAKGADLEAGQVSTVETGATEGGSDRHSAGAAHPEHVTTTVPASAAPVPVTPFAYQVAVLTDRMFRQWLRNPIMLFSEFVQYGFLALFMGLTFLRLTHNVDTGVTDRLSSLWFAMAILSTTPSFTAVTIWDKDRVLVRRETTQGMYSPAAWYAARTLTVSPFQVAQTVAFCIITYWMIGYAPTGVAFLLYLVTYCVFQLISESVGFIIAFVTKNSTYAILVMTIVLLLMMSFSGFLVSSIPVYFRWLRRLSYQTYAYSALVYNEFTREDFYDSQGNIIPGWTLIPDQMDDDLGIGLNILVLCCMYIGIRLMGLVMLLVLVHLRKL